VFQVIEADLGAAEMEFVGKKIAELEKTGRQILIERDLELLAKEIRALGKKVERIAKVIERSGTYKR
jgi:hypothetical protein